MTLTVEEILTGLGIPAETYAGKSAELQNWNGKISAIETTASSAMTAAEKKLADAQALSRIIDSNIANFGMTETNVAELRANNAALTAALEEVKKAGFTGINIPDLPKPGSTTVDPAEQFRTSVAQGFAQMGQAMNAINRYYRVMGKPLPEDPTTLADNAARMRLSVNDYVEQTYKLTEAERTQTAAAQQKDRDDYAALKVKEWQDAHPAVTGHPDLNGGLPSAHSAMPKPMEAKEVRQFAALPAREKIAISINRAKETMQRMNSAT